MPTQLGGYDLTFFAQEALIFLRRQLGFGSRIHRGFDPAPQQRGNKITIGGPGNFVVNDAPSQAQSVNAREVTITLDNWKEVKFYLTDKDLAASEDRILTDHVQPAAYALASHVSNTIAAMYKRIPYAVDFDDANIKRSLLAARAQLQRNGAPMMDGNIFAALSPGAEGEVLAADFMTRYDSAGAQSQTPLTEGSLARRFGVELFGHGDLPQHVAGSAVSGDNVGALSAAAVKGASVIAVDGFTDGQALKEGDAFVIAGSTQRYVVTADVALAGGSANLPVYPELAQDYADNAQVTFDTATGTNAESFTANQVFHRHAYALGTAPLQGQLGSQMARNQGIEVENIVDEEEALSIRSRMWYDPDNSRTVVALDLLYGVEVLNPELAVRLRRESA